MKICILTHALRSNYGGLLQAYALQKVLKNLGHDVVTDKILFNEIPLCRKILRRGKHIILSVLGKRRFSDYPYFLSKENLAIINSNANVFIDKHISYIYLTKSGKINKDYDGQFEAFVVGSDQVWRKGATENNTRFLNFLKEDDECKRVAYAASFGISDWMYSLQETEELKSLLSKFDLITVREDSAQELLKEHIGIESTHVLDPTLLLSKDCYENIVNDDITEPSDGELFTYILDVTSDKAQIIERVADKLNMKVYSCMSDKVFMNNKIKNINDYIFPKTSQWLRSFMDAKFVVTDSFHGTVFSIIFNKQFIVIANRNRGLTRFTSLLKIFNLENRLFYTSRDLKVEIVEEQINYNEIGQIIKHLKQKSLQLLMSHLK